MEKYVEVFAASDITLAYLLKAKLEDAGIPVQIDNENLQGAYCIDGMVPRVLVPSRYEDEARQIIQEIQHAPEEAWDEDSDEFEDNEDDFEIDDFEDEDDTYE